MFGSHQLLTCPVCLLFVPPSLFEIHRVAVAFGPVVSFSIFLQPLFRSRLNRLHSRALWKLLREDTSKSNLAGNNMRMGWRLRISTSQVRSRDQAPFLPSVPLAYPWLACPLSWHQLPTLQAWCLANPNKFCVHVLWCGQGCHLSHSYQLLLGPPLTIWPSRKAGLFPLKILGMKPEASVEDQIGCIFQFASPLWAKNVCSLGRFTSQPFILPPPILLPVQIWAKKFAKFRPQRPHYGRNGRQSKVSVLDCLFLQTSHDHPLCVDQIQFGSWFFFLALSFLCVSQKNDWRMTKRPSLFQKTTIQESFGNHLRYFYEAPKWL